MKGWSVMRKRDMIILLAAVLALVGVSESFAWRPSGWVFMNYPYAFDRASSDWYYKAEYCTIARTLASLQSYSASMIGLRTVRFPPAAR